MLVERTTDGGDPSCRVGRVQYRDDDVVQAPVACGVGHVEGDVVDAGHFELELQAWPVEDHGLPVVLEGPGVVDDAHLVVAPPPVQLDPGVLVLDPVGSGEGHRWVMVLEGGEAHQRVAVGAPADDAVGDVPDHTIVCGAGISRYVVGPVVALRAIVPGIAVPHISCLSRSQVVGLEAVVMDRVALAGPIKDEDSRAGASRERIVRNGVALGAAPDGEAGDLHLEDVPVHQVARGPAPWILVTGGIVEHRGRGGLLEGQLARGIDVDAILEAHGSVPREGGVQHAGGQVAPGEGGMTAIGGIQVVEQRAGCGGVHAAGNDVVVDALECQTGRGDVHRSVLGGEVLGVVPVAGLQAGLHHGEVGIEARIGRISVPATPGHEEDGVRVEVLDHGVQYTGGGHALLPVEAGGRKAWDLALVLKDHRLPGPAVIQGDVPLMAAGLDPGRMVGEGEAAPRQRGRHSVGGDLVQLSLDESSQVVRVGVAVPHQQNVLREVTESHTIVALDEGVVYDPVVIAVDGYADAILGERVVLDPVAVTAQQDRLISNSVEGVVKYRDLVAAVVTPDGVAANSPGARELTVVNASIIDVVQSDARELERAADGEPLDTKFGGIDDDHVPGPVVRDDRIRPVADQGKALVDADVLDVMTRENPDEVARGGGVDGRLDGRERNATAVVDDEYLGRPVLRGRVPVVGPSAIGHRPRHGARHQQDQHDDGNGSRHEQPLYTKMDATGKKDCISAGHGA